MTEEEAREAVCACARTVRDQWAAIERIRERASRNEAVKGDDLRLASRSEALTRALPDLAEAVDTLDAIQGRSEGFAVVNGVRV